MINRTSRARERMHAFQRERKHLLSIAFRILGSQTDAEDVVQETWIRYDRADTSDVANLPAWLTTIAARLCIDVLRRRRDVPVEDIETAVWSETTSDPEQATLLASELTTAFTIVLSELTPPQRIALVLHDAFAFPFEEIAHVLETTPSSAKKLASRARERVRSRAVISPPDTTMSRALVAEFLRATQTGNVERFLSLLDPKVIRLADSHVLPRGVPQRLEGARVVAEEAMHFRAVAARASLAEIDGQPGIAVYHDLALELAIVVCIVQRKVAQFEVIADPQRLGHLDVRTSNST
jgi:RNA polymerase sigma factor (sigma-70 family)